MTREIINTYDQLIAAGGGIAICRRDGGWRLLHVNEKGEALVTDKNAHWSDSGSKVFSAFGRGLPHYKAMDEAFQEAARWVANKYGEFGPWVGNLMQDRIPARIKKQFPIKRSKP